MTTANFGLFCTNPPFPVFFTIKTFFPLSSFISPCMVSKSMKFPSLLRFFWVGQPLTLIGFVNSQIVPVVSAFFDALMSFKLKNVFFHVHYFFSK